MQNATIFEPAGMQFRERLSVAVSADDCGWSDRCFRFEGKLTFDERPTAERFDVRLTLTGTYRNAGGRVVAVPAEPLVFRWAAGAYAPVLGTPALRALWQGIESPWR
jgi:hypothetical protein